MKIKYEKLMQDLKCFKTT